MTQFPAENIRDWLDQDVVDSTGDKIGSLESIYFDTAADTAAFATIQVGVLGRKRLVFAPLVGAVVTPKHLKLQVDKKTVKDAPSIEPDGELSSDAEPAVFAHYGLPYALGVNGERRLGRR